MSSRSGCVADGLLLGSPVLKDELEPLVDEHELKEEGDDGDGLVVGVGGRREHMGRIVLGRGVSIT